MAGLLVTGAGCSSRTVVVDGRPGQDAAAELHGAVTELHGAADALLRSGSSRVRTSVEMATGGTRVAVRGRGGYDFGRRLGRLRLVLPRDAAGEVEHPPVTELLAPGALFLRNRGAGVPADKWVRVDTSGVPDGNLVTGGATDPLTAAELLRAARGVRLMGEELLAADPAPPGGAGPAEGAGLPGGTGVPDRAIPPGGGAGLREGPPDGGGGAGPGPGTRVRHFRGVTDLRRAARAASAGVREALRAAARGYTEPTVAFDAYLDERGRLRKVRYRFLVTGALVGSRTAGAGRGQAVASTTELYDFGARVAVRLPAPEDIYTGTVGSPGA
ncbi:hypothetical protein ACZ90_49445 [Streptomyces albus subsp. albus]|nr:hypothetical protein ACZ90_49445 [Streptomyces albus subsp. albus]